MKKILPLLIVGLLVFSGLGAVAFPSGEIKSDFDYVGDRESTISLNRDELDQYQTEFEAYALVGSYPPFNIQVAQSFVPTKDILTRVELYIHKESGSLTYPYVVAIRDHFYGVNLAEATVSPDDIPIGPPPTWIEFDFDDIQVIPGEHYLIVSYKTYVDATRLYGWGVSNSNPYPHGETWLSDDGGQTWGYSEDIDTCFKTYGTYLPLEVDANGPYHGIKDSSIDFSGSAHGGVQPYSWYWDFGDGNFSDEQNPNHTYANPGNYTVTLTVTDAEENSSEDTTWAFIVERTELGIDISKEGIVIKNTGDAAAYDVEWTVDITGGFLGLINKHLEGSEEELTVGEEITMTLPFLLGLGPLTVSATAETSNADSIAEAKDGFILLFFIILP